MDGVNNRLMWIASERTILLEDRARIDALLAALDAEEARLAQKMESPTES